MRNHLPIILAVLPLITSCGEHPAIPVNDRPANWAQPVELDGAPNLHKVTGNLYRSAQPSTKGMRNLEALGIKTVINLRAIHSDDDELEDTKMQGEHIRFATWHPEQNEVVRFLKLVNDPEKQPVLVHCLHGADRTGTMCAIYRVVVEDWSKDDAIREMKEGDYNFHSIWNNLTRWIEELDVEATRKAAGLSADTTD
ncbi:MAG: tyrosine-protein phosphatase [Verrucomicrobia bacterium]|nr:tyrosine-protein phosphatase [Verrucomicrobiota bacterium]MDA1087471.1 tyrosine-protein phosphatase [Verrucomicrobiota bacterium]